VYGKEPDIALHHPKRYRYGGRDGTQPMTDWWVFNPLYSDTDLTNVHSVDFFKIKGFFVNPWTAPADAGPQMTMADEGTQLRLAARIYNYSLAGLPTGGNVKVRFYGHELGEDGNTWVDGGCFPIGEASVTIDGFRTDEDAVVATNRAQAETMFDTTGRGGQYLVFWVVAWAEDGIGDLVRELTQHGLQAKPPEGCPANSILGVPVEFYSNNVGFYDQPFYILPKDTATPSEPADEPSEPFSIGALDVLPISPERPYCGDVWELVAPLQASSEDAVSVHLVHAGAGPGGRVIDTRIIPFIDAGQTFTDRLSFQPQWCGPHAAVVTARPAFQELVSATKEFEVPCRPQDVTAFFNDVLMDASLAGAVEVNRNGEVKGRLAALQRAVLTAERLAEKGAVRGACAQYARALERVADAADGPVALQLEDIIHNARVQLGCRATGVGHGERYEDR
jgi:hypothetical protein